LENRLRRRRYGNAQRFRTLFKQRFTTESAKAGSLAAWSPDKIADLNALSMAFISPTFQQPPSHPRGVSQARLAAAKHNVMDNSSLNNAPDSPLELSSGSPTAEAGYRLLAENSSEVISHHAPDGTLLYVSPSIKRVLGFDAAELTGARVFDYLHPEDVAHVRKELDNRIENGGAGGLMQFRQRHKDGHFIWMGTNARVLLDPTTQIKGIVAVSRDITEEMELAETLAQLAAENKALVENSLDVMTLSDHEGRFLRVNAAATEILGYQPQELLGRRYIEFTPPAAQETALAMEAGLRMGKNSIQDFESPWIRKDGSIALLSWSVRLSEDMRLTYATARDVTERHHTQAALQQSKDQLSTVLESIGDAFFTADREWRITYANRKAAEFVGLAQQSGIGKIIWELVPEILTSSVFPHLQKAMETGEQAFFDACYEPASVWIEVRAYPHEDGLSVYFHDITARRHAENAILRSEQRFRNLFEQAGDSIIIVDSEMRILDVNGRACQELGYTRAELLTRHITDIEVGFKIEQEFWSRLRPGDSRLIEGIKKRKDGTTFPAEIHISRFDDDDKVLFQAIARDVTEREEAQRIIRESGQRLREVIEMTPAGYLVTDAQAMLVEVNPALCRMSGYAQEELIGHSMMLLFPDCPCNGTLFVQDGATSIHGTEAAIKHKTGSFVYVLVNANIKRDHEGNGLSVTAIISDITERKQTESRLEQMATHDTLTGLPNRVLIDQRLQQMMDAVRDDESLAVLFIDLDRFKAVNDSMGHKRGDILLREVARRLQQNLRPGDTIARLGGDEFVVAAPCSKGTESAVKIAQRLFAALAAPIEIAGQEVFVGASIGISMFPQDGRTRELLFQNADTAMYRAKATGRNGYRFYEADMSAEAKTRMVLEHSLPHALERNEFELHYQPRIDLKTMGIVGMEALIRWNHPQLGQISPMQFIPIAEERGLIDAIGRWVLDEACTQTRRLMGKFGRPLRVSVNLSARQLKSHDILGQVRASLKKTNFPPRLLELELTESALIDDMELCAALLKALKDLGISLSVDDFGTGYSALAYLRRFPLDTLKLDRSFLNPQGDGISSFKFIKAFVDLAHALNLAVVAEGVETKETLQFLRDASCDEAQGYLFAKPLPYDQLEAFMARLPATEAKTRAA
jgi:diguanylate cyclase (GGDEF)-like protein/PAS domain S-box-containing protein